MPRLFLIRASQPLGHECYRCAGRLMPSALKVKVKVKWLSCVQLFVTPWTAAHQAPPSVGFSRQEYTHLKDNKVITLCSEFSNLEEMNHRSLKTNYQNLTHRKQVICIDLELVNKLPL